MVIYITDKQGFVLATAANDLPNNSLLLDDKLTDQVETGFEIFEATLQASSDIREACEAGNYVMAYDRPFTILTATYSTKDGTIQLYCEDAGLDLINHIAPKVKKQTKTFAGWINNTIGSSSGWSFNYIDGSSQQLELEYTSESNVLERLKNVLNSFNQEMYFSYELQGFDFVQRVINFTEKRGSETIHTLRMDEEVMNITKTDSVMDLATVWKMYGADNKPLSKLSGYSTATKTKTIGDYTFQVIGDEVQCIEGMEEQQSKLSNDGRIVQVKYTNYKKAQSCINYAFRELSKICKPAVTFEIEVSYLPDDIRAGDTVKILDDEDEVYLQARVLEWSMSDSLKQYSVVLGDFQVLESSMADIDYNAMSIYTMSITSSNGLIGKDSLNTTLSVTIYLNGSVITSAAELPEGELIWYEDDVLVPSTDSRIADSGFTFNTGTITQGHTYRCELEEGQ